VPPRREPVQITIRLFARLREIVGSGELTRDVPDRSTAQTAWDLLAKDFPAIGAYERAVSCAVNAEYARFSTPLRDGDEVAFLPPVSGGEIGTVRRSGGAKPTSCSRR